LLLNSLCVIISIYKLESGEIMEFQILNFIKLFIATLLPVATSILVYFLEKKTKFNKLTYWKKQILIGLIFGAIACLATEFGIQINGATINVRNAAPLASALLFGGPSGIIAGVIGGIYRFFATYWGAGEFSQIACTIGCILAGLIGAFSRKYLFDNKKAPWLAGIAIAGTSETLHMLLIFITKMDNVYFSYQVVEACALAMITCNSISVMLSLLIVSLIGKEKRERTRGRGIAQVFQFLLMICVIVAFFATTIFTYSLQTRIAYAEVDSILKLNLEDVEKDVKEYSDDNLLRITKEILREVTKGSTSDELNQLLSEDRYNVAEINIIDENGIIIQSTNSVFKGWDMNSGEQSREFMCLLNGEKEYVQKYMPLSINTSISRKYAGVAFDDGGFLQVGYDAKQFQTALSSEIITSVRNRHIGQNGTIIVCDEELNILNKDYLDNNNSSFNKKSLSGMQLTPYKRFKSVIGNTDVYFMYTSTEGFYIAAYLPISEAIFSRNIAVTILVFMEVIVYATLFALIYYLLKKLIVDNIHRINSSLGQITNGDLSVYVNVRENVEFASLSDDINATVDTLKGYIKEAENRIDRELEFARQIQKSSLPSVFPPYPERKEFDIYASMDAAKEVGGDFYDFFFTDKNHLAILVADVSGKGIPAALFMMRAKTLIKNLTESGKSVDEVLTLANKALCENNDAEMFVTAWLGVINLETLVLEYASAGHNPPLIKLNDKFEYLKTKPNFILAGLEMSKYKKHEIKLLPGSQIFLYTDGVTEATNSDNLLYGEERLIDILNKEELSPELLCEKVKEDIKAFVKDAMQSDDITMLSVKINKIAPCATLELTPDNTSIKQANDFITQTLEKWEIDMKSTNKVMLALDEIYSNIVYYSKATLATIKLSKKEDGIEIIFEDNGTPYDPTKVEDPDVTLSADERKIGGLGIFMVKKIASSVTYKYENKNILNVFVKF